MPTAPSIDSKNPGEASGVRASPRKTTAFKKWTPSPKENGRRRDNTKRCKTAGSVSIMRSWLSQTIALDACISAQPIADAQCHSLLCSESKKAPDGDSNYCNLKPIECPSDKIHVAMPTSFAQTPPANGQPVTPPLVAVICKPTYKTEKEKGHETRGMSRPLTRRSLRLSSIKCSVDNSVSTGDIQVTKKAHLEEDPTSASSIPEDEEEHGAREKFCSMDLLPNQQTKLSSHSCQMKFEGAATTCLRLATDAGPEPVKDAQSSLFGNDGEQPPENCDESKESVLERISGTHLPDHARVGLLIWVKQKGSPFWPSMLTYDPTTGECIRRNSDGVIRTVHVQFFGSVITRAWSSYRSAVKLWDYSVQDGGWGYFKTRVKPSLQEDFDIAVSQACAAAQMSLRERILEWTCFGEHSPDEAGPEPQDEPKSKTKCKRKYAAVQTETDAPSKPKRFASAFFLFYKDRRKAFQNTGQTRTDVTRLIGQEWRNLTASEKEPYLKMEDLGRQEYHKAKEKYREALRIYEGKGCSMTQNSVSGTTVIHRPKRGRSAYILFYMEKEQEVAATSSSRKDVLAQIGRMWRDLPPEEKSVYELKKQEDQKRYHRELLQYEADAILSLGRKCVESFSNCDHQDEILTQIQNLPNIAVSGHVCFALQEAKEIDSNLDDVEAATHILTRWKALSAEQQQEWNQKAAAIRRRVNKLSASKSSSTSDIDDTNDGTHSQKDRTPQSADLCGICGESGRLVCCEGGCFSSFHIFCIGLSREPEGAFICDACATGNHLCFACERPSGPEGLIKCCERGCDKRFHLSCMKNNPRAVINGTSVRCPLHICANCNNPPASTFPLIRCIRCPIAYHTCCVPAGCINSSNTYLLCPRHQPVEKRSKANMCLACGNGGMLYCCDTCPSAYHAECLSEVQDWTGSPSTEGSWQCHECLGGSKAITQDIIWHKLGSHRFWPARIMEEDEISEPLQNIRPQGICFPVSFFGTNDTAWARHDSVIRWSAGDESSRFTNKKAKPIFHKAVEDAAKAFASRHTEYELLLEALKGRTNLKPPSFQRIRTNLCTVPRKRVPVHECMCTDACEESCLNRIVFCECDPKTCPVGDKCQNRRFQRRSYPKLIPFLTSNKALCANTKVSADDGCPVANMYITTYSNRSTHVYPGWGLKAGKDIEEGQFVVEYVGEVIGINECRRRLAESEKASEDSFYILSLGANEFVDARNKANLARFINHSCAPNCEIQKWNVLGYTRVGIFAKQRIPRGTELTFDYQLDSLGSSGRTECNCGVPSCRGFIEKARKQAIDPEVDLSGGDEHDVCHECGEGGILLLCDRKGCSRCYHPECVGLLDGIDHVDEWFCPKHTV